jgi:sulfoxide reductase heme-binding subunit YedZ
VHVFALGELAWMALDFFGGRLTANPLQALQQRTGRHAITLLVLSLACTPLSNLLGWRELPKRSRTLGLYAFMVAFLHILIFVDLDNGLAWDSFSQTIVQKPYILFGMATFLLLIPGGDVVRRLEGACARTGAAAQPPTSSPHRRAALRPSRRRYSKGVTSCAR